MKQVSDQLGRALSQHIQPYMRHARGQYRFDPGELGGIDDRCQPQSQQHGSGCVVGNRAPVHGPLAARVVIAGCVLTARCAFIARCVVAGGCRVVGECVFAARWVVAGGCMVGVGCAASGCRGTAGCRVARGSVGPGTGKMLQHRIHVLQLLKGHGQQPGTGLGECYRIRGASRTAFEQGCAQCVFQNADLSGQRWLADEEPFGGTPEIQFFGQHAEVMQLAQRDGVGHGR